MRAVHVLLVFSDRQDVLTGYGVSCSLLLHSIVAPLTPITVHVCPPQHISTNNRDMAASDIGTRLRVEAGRFSQHCRENCVMTLRWSKSTLKLHGCDKNKRMCCSITCAAFKFTSSYCHSSASTQSDISFSSNMQLSLFTFLATALAMASTMASPIAPRNASDPVVAQATPWTPDRCDHDVIGVVAGTSYIQMLRNSWQIKFASFESTPSLDVCDPSKK